MKKLIKYIPAIIIAAFGFLTLFLSTTVILDLVGMCEKQGNYVLFVIWVNFFCGLAYVVAAYGFVKSKTWTAKLLAVAMFVLIMTYFAFTSYVNGGGVHKEDTFGALLFRLGVTTVFTLIAYFTINKKIENN
jgi:hypothetical protein